MKSRLFMVCSLLFVSLRAPASSFKCESIFRESTPATNNIAAISKEIIAKAEASLENPELSLTFRGFIASNPEPTPELSALLAKRGIFRWGTRFYPVESIDAAKRHSAKEADPFMHGNYVIVPGITEAQIRELLKQEGPIAYADLLKRGEVIFIESTFETDPDSGLAKIDPVTRQALGLRQTVRKVRRDVLDAAIDSSKIEWFTPPSDASYLYSMGWVLPHARGVIERDNIFYAANKEGRRTLATSYKNILSFARKKKREGFSFKFNNDFQRSLDMARDQERREPDGSWTSEESNYKTPEFYNAALANFKAGKSFSVEVWNEKNELVGGVLASRVDSIFRIDTAFYDNKRYPKESIDFAKAAGVMLAERLADAGIYLLDMEQLTPYSKSLRGRVVPTKYFLREVDRLNSNASLDLTTPWTPPDATAYLPPQAH